MKAIKRFFIYKSNNHKNVKLYALAIPVLLLIVSSLYSPDIFYALGLSPQHPLDKMMVEKRSGIRQRALELAHPALFREFGEVGQDTLYAKLIHHYNQDFYGRGYGLSTAAEKMLLAAMAGRGFDRDDLCGLSRPFGGDSVQTLREWLLLKTGGTPKNNPYYNPVYRQLQDQIAELQQKLQAALSLQFSDTQKRDMLASVSAAQHVSSDSALSTLAHALIKAGGLNDTLVTIYKRYYETRQELNMRLGLFHIFLSYEYNARKKEQVFAWLLADHDGLEYYKYNRYKRERYFPDRTWLAARVEPLSLLAAQYDSLFDELGLNDREIQLYNPLRRELVAKRVGRFSAHRKNNWGRAYKHKGLDLVADEGTPVFPVRDGFVEYVGNKRNGHGNHIRIRHDNRVVSVYSHLSNDRLWRNTLRRYRDQGSFWITAQEPIATVGTTGNIPKYDAQYGYAHLHLEVIVGGKWQNPAYFFDAPLTVVAE